MSELLYKNEDSSFTVIIKEEMVSAIYKMCQASYPKETGGILIGRYSSDLNSAHVTLVTREPADSKSGRTWFHRGTKGLQKLLDMSWDKKGEFYLGEWHYHPGGYPNPSFQDILEMKRIAKNAAYNCPEPILIIAGNPSPDDWELGAYVFVDKKYELLKPNY